MCTRDRDAARAPSGGGASRAPATCARPAVLIGVGLDPMEAHCACGTALSVAARPCSDVRAAASKRAVYLRICVRKKSATACALSLSGRSAARALATCVRPAALVGVGPYPMEAHCASGTALSLGALLCSDVRAAASKRTAYLRMCARKKRLHARSLSLGRKRSTRACDVRAPRRAGWSRSVPYGSPLCQRDGSLHRCTAVLRRASRGLQTSSLLAHVRKNKEAPPRALSLSREEAQHALAACARPAALVGLGPCHMKAHCASPLCQRDGPLPR